MNTQEYLKHELDKWLATPLEKKNKKTKPVIALVGLGPHAKRIYLNYFQKHKIDFALLIDLASKKEEVRKYLDDNGFKDTKIFTLEDSLKDNDTLPKNESSNLRAVCNTMEITHIFIATEPKAHNMYLRFALENSIDVLTDKPITVTKNMTSMKSINKVRKQYYDILKLAENSNSMCKVMCQRQYHKGYEFIKKMLSEVVQKYQVPITFVDIFHCDGNWEMPHDMMKENHPYKYGYGKLFHSGYHFIDLLSDLIKINTQLTGTKKIIKGEIYSSCLTPNEELNVFNIEDYKRIFKKQQIPKYYEENTNPKFNNFGEKNFYGSLDFKNKFNQLITHVNLNLLHYGFSRRGWIESKEYYKNNGRIRHESITIEVGTLMSIQIHSYQSKEIKDRTVDLNLEEQVGGLEHFDIDIYRNVDIIGGKPFERIKLGDLYTEKEKKDILGYNELSREVYISNFLKGKCEKGDIKDQELAIEILHGCAIGLHNYYNNKKTSVKIDMKNKAMNTLKIDYLKQFKELNTQNATKRLLKSCDIEKKDYELSIIMNQLTKKMNYEIFMVIDSNNNTVGGLLFKKFSNKVLAFLYFKYLILFAKHKKINKIVKRIEKHGQNKVIAE